MWLGSSKKSVEILTIIDGLERARPDSATLAKCGWKQSNKLAGDQFE